MKMTKIYKRRGDSGMTDLVGGVRISKADIRLDAYGTIDELSSHLGLLVSIMEPGEERDYVINIQNNLFCVASHLATDQSQTKLYPSGYLAEGETARLEQRIDMLKDLLPEAQGFILPGGCTAAAQCHVCRTVCRRAERCITQLASEAIVGKDIIQYVNRLSDYLFILAKVINYEAGHAEIVWQKPSS